MCEQNNTVYEYYGCLWHDCTTCYRANINKNKKEMEISNKQTIEKREMVKSARYKHVEIKESMLIKSNKDFQRFRKTTIRDSWIFESYRDGFYGGQTNTSKL